MMDVTIQEAAKRIRDGEQAIREATVILRTAATDLARKGDVHGLRTLAGLLPEDRKFEDRPNVTVRYISTRQIFERTAAEIEGGQIPDRLLSNIDFNRR